MKQELLRAASPSRRGVYAAAGARSRSRAKPAADLQAVARGRHAAPRCRVRALPAGGVRRRPAPGLARRGRGRVRRAGRVLPAHVPHRGPARAAAERGAAAARRGRRPDRRAADELRRRQDALADRALPPRRRATAARSSRASRRCSRRPGSRLRPRRSAPCSSGRCSARASPRQKADGTRCRRCGASSRGSSAARRATRSSRSADERGTNPGDALVELLERNAPCLILIDEWVAYARQLYGRDGLPAGTFDAQFTFAQALTDAAQERAERDARRLDPAVGHRGRRRGGQAGADAALERGRPAGGVVAAGVGRRGLRDRPAAAVRGRAGRDGARARRGRHAFGDLYRKQTAEFPLECARGGLRAAARERRTRSTPSCSTGSTTTGRRSRSSSGRAACCG